MSEHCLFCKINQGIIPGQFVYRDSEIIVFKDINPKAPVHLLIVPTKHIDRIENSCSDDVLILGKMIDRARLVAKEQGLENGYRLIINNGEDGGQEVEHIHLHLLGGRNLGAMLPA